MTKRLILIRHAKSSWDNPSDDHARTLNPRGRRSATAIGQWLHHEGHLPQSIYTSDAARTVETTERMLAAMDHAPEVTTLPRLYHASPDTIMEVMRNATGDTIAIVAHNPGIAFFADDIVGQKPDHSRFFDYPTGATLVCDFDINEWADAVSRSAHVVDFVVPRDLPDQ